MIYDDSVHACRHGAYLPRLLLVATLYMAAGLSLWGRGASDDCGAAARMVGETAVSPERGYRTEYERESDRTRETCHRHSPSLAESGVGDGGSSPSAETELQH